MRTNSGGAQPGLGVPPRELLVPAVVLAAYGIVRILAAVWGPVRDGVPGSRLGWSVVAANGAAALLAWTAAAVVAVPQLRRRRALRWFGVSAAAMVWICCGVWVALGHGEAMPQVRDLLLALGFAVAILLVCDWRPHWAVGPDRVDWSRLHRALLVVVGGGVALGIAGLAVYVAARPSGALHRLTVVLFELGLWGAFVVFLCLMMVVGEQRRERREAVMRDFYAQLSDRHDANDDVT